jgi:hypothetical protein
MACGNQIKISGAPTTQERPASRHRPVPLEVSWSSLRKVTTNHRAKFLCEGLSLSRDAALPSPYSEMFFALDCLTNDSKILNGCVATVSKITATSNF